MLLTESGSGTGDDREADGDHGDGGVAIGGLDPSEANNLNDDAALQELTRAGWQIWVAYFCAVLSLSGWMGIVSILSDYEQPEQLARFFAAYTNALLTTLGAVLCWLPGVIGWWLSRRRLRQCRTVTIVWAGRLCLASLLVGLIVVLAVLPEALWRLG